LRRGRPLMAARFQLRQLVSPGFLRELHHFLWTAPRLTGNCVDAGWDCRDHALVLSFLLQDFGIECAVAHGEAVFGRGPTAGKASSSYSQNPHSWLIVKDLGAIDLSIKPAFTSAGECYEVPLDGVFLNRSLGNKKCVVGFFADNNNFRLAADSLCVERNAAGAAYWQCALESLDPSLRSGGAGWMRSALAVELDVRYGNPSPLYAELVSHLSALLRNKTQSLAASSFEAAWATLAARIPATAAPEGRRLNELQSAA